MGSRSSSRSSTSASTVSETRTGGGVAAPPPAAPLAVAHGPRSDPYMLRPPMVAPIPPRRPPGGPSTTGDRVSPDRYFVQDVVWWQPAPFPC
jgi:hypothetical protein